TEDGARRTTWETELAAVEKKIAAAVPDLDKRQAEWEKTASADTAKLPAAGQAALKAAPAKRKTEQKAELVKHFRGTFPEVKELQKSVDDLRARLATVQPVPTPIMRELGDGKKRVTKVHVRGDWLNLGKEVTPAVPTAFNPLPKGEPANRL